MALGVNTIKQLPFLRTWLKRRALRKYLSPQGAGYHAGRFATFDAARAWLPATPGFVHERFTDEYVNERSKRIYTFDYPVLVWLRHAFDQGAASILDVGGSIGNHFYAYQRYLSYPAQIQWTVFELPAFIQQGRDVALQRAAKPLHFTDALTPEVLSADIWIAAGVLEFMEFNQLGDMLDQAARRPTHIIINKLPLWNRDDIVSTQNIGFGSFVPHRVYNRSTFVAALESRGYKLLDEWEVPDRSFTSLGAPEDCFECYSGLYFKAV
jgi:putative methyltransferase (TIGR04325 family)